MKKEIVLYRPLFLAVCIVCGFLLLVRAWRLHPLYFSADLRHQAELAMRHVEKQEGWLLSDVSVQSITNTEMQVLHRSHIRGRDPVSCSIISLSSFALRPCDNAR